MITHTEWRGFLRSLPPETVCSLDTRKAKAFAKKLRGIVDDLLALLDFNPKPNASIEEEDVIATRTTPRVRTTFIFSPDSAVEYYATFNAMANLVGVRDSLADDDEDNDGEVFQLLLVAIDSILAYLDARELVGLAREDHEFCEIFSEFTGKIAKAFCKRFEIPNPFLGEVAQPRSRVLNLQQP